MISPIPMLAPVGSALPSGLRTTKLLPAGRVTPFTSIPRVLSPAVPLKVSRASCWRYTVVTDLGISSASSPPSTSFHSVNWIEPVVLLAGVTSTV